MNRTSTILLCVALVLTALLVFTPREAAANLPSGWGAADDVGTAVHAPSGISGHFSLVSDQDDVITIWLDEGDRVSLVLIRDAGTGAKPYLYPPGTTTVEGDTWVAVGTQSPDNVDAWVLTYDATTSGNYYMDVWVPSDGADGGYTIFHSSDVRDEDSRLYDNGAPPGVPIFVPPSGGHICGVIDTDDVYAVDLDAGQNFTFKVTDFDTSPGPDLSLYFYEPGAPSVGRDADGWLVSKSTKPNTSTERISYVAPVSGRYSLDVFADSEDDDLYTGGWYDYEWAWLDRPSVASTLKANKTYNVTSWLYPKRPTGTKPVTIVCERVKGGKLTKTFSAKASTDEDWSKCTASVKLPKGTWRIKAKRTDATLGTFYSGYKTVTVK